MPTKQEILDYFDKDARVHTPYSASLHFGIAIEDIYRILGDKDE